MSSSFALPKRSLELSAFLVEVLQAKLAYTRERHRLRRYCKSVGTTFRFATATQKGLSFRTAAFRLQEAWGRMERSVLPKGVATQIRDQVRPDPLPPKTFVERHRAVLKQAKLDLASVLVANQELKVQHDILKSSVERKELKDGVDYQIRTGLGSNLFAYRPPEAVKDELLANNLLYACGFRGHTGPSSPAAAVDALRLAAAAVGWVVPVKEEAKPPPKPVPLLLQAPVERKLEMPQVKPEKPKPVKPVMEPKGVGSQALPEREVDQFPHLPSHGSAAPRKFCRLVGGYICESKRPNSLGDLVMPAYPHQHKIDSKSILRLIEVHTARDATHFKLYDTSFRHKNIPVSITEHRSVIESHRELLSLAYACFASLGGILPSVLAKPVQRGIYADSNIVSHKPVLPSRLKDKKGKTR